MADLTTTSSSNPSTPKDTKPRSRDRDSGVFLSDSEDNTVKLIPSPNDDAPLASQCPISSPSHQNTSCAPTTSSPLTPRQTLRHRPTPLPLPPKSPSPKSELETRFSLLRATTSKSQVTSSSSTNATTSTATTHLKSPTALLRARLGLSPTTTEKRELPERNFVPPREVGKDGCIMPRPKAGIPAFEGRNITGRTEDGGKMVWWCRVDKVVVLDGVVDLDTTHPKKFLTRTSKGLESSRRRNGTLETVIIGLECVHCREMLGMGEWRYEVRVCERRVCWECRERCAWEWGREMDEREEDKIREGERGSEERIRERADSVLQNPAVEERRLEELSRKVGIEMADLSLIETVGGIEERLEEVD